MSSLGNNLLLLFDRPYEPVFTPKGDGDKVIQVPEEYLDERYKKLNTILSLGDRYATDSTEKILVEPIPNPGLTLPESLKKDEKFSLFIPLHREMASQVIEFLLGMYTVEDFWAAAVYFRANLNPELFNYALSVAMINKPETQDSELYSLNELFPDKFYEGDVVYRAMEEVAVTRNTEERINIDIAQNYTATDLDLEHSLAYFREDIGVNLHHWHWHLVYPFGPELVANKDRRGELFYYMHQQIIARYNMERFCNRLPRVKRLLNLQDPIEEAYFSKLTSKQSSRNWPGRGMNSVMRDVSRPKEGLFFDIQDMERWRNRIYDAIHQGFIITKAGDKLNLTERDGIDILGNLLEASVLSKNYAYYGDFHSMMHVATACIHDPDYRHVEPFSVMGDVATAMRDPVFYRIHMMVDDMFQAYKSTLPGYTYEELNFKDVSVKSVSIHVDGKKDNNQLFTFWEKSAANLSRGLDFAKRGSVYANFTHLQHQSFKYHIKVENNGRKRTGTVRIFIAPRFDERGETMGFNEQRKFFVELDRFEVSLDKGTNSIEHLSEESSVTIPFEQTYRNLEKKRPKDGSSGLDSFNFCGCGWPHNLLIAKGTETGFPCQLFVMVSDFAEDEVKQDDSTTSRCKNAMSYCGIRNKKYPDARAMGFPFDRNARKDANKLEDFLTPNMSVVDVKIFHDGKAA